MTTYAVALAVKSLKYKTPQWQLMS